MSVVVRHPNNERTKKECEIVTFKQNAINNICKNVYYLICVAYKICFVFEYGLGFSLTHSLPPLSSVNAAVINVC